MPKEQIFEIKKPGKPEVPEKEISPKISWSPEATKQGEELVSQISSLKESLDQAEAAGDLKTQEKILDQITPLTERLEVLAKEEAWLFEQLTQKELAEQYESQKKIFEKAGILEKLSSGETGIKGIDKKEYAFPKMEEISKLMRENQEVLKTKTEQGFTNLLIVPFGMKLDDLIERYKQVILKHHKAGKLFATKKEPKEPDKPLELDEKEPVWAWGKYKNADTEGKLVYYPKEFSQENHQGKTKKEILEKEGAWNILFIEDLPNIPREGKGETIGERKQLEANKTPKEYLNALQDESIYQNETGMTPEDQLVYALIHLEQTNQVIDDYSGHGSASYQLGAYFPASGDVPDADWNRDNRQVYLYRFSPGVSSSGGGLRSAVRVLKS